jgi:hypothetical protein
MLIHLSCNKTKSCQQLVYSQSMYKNRYKVEKEAEEEDDEKPT